MHAFTRTALAMPLLRFTTAIDAPGDEWQGFAAVVAERYADHMDTGTSHVAVERTRVDRTDLWLGQSVPGGMVFLDADIREGRSHDQRRAFALTVLDEVAARWNVPEPNMKVSFTEHDGRSLTSYDRVGDAWSPDEADG